MRQFIHYFNLAFVSISAISTIIYGEEALVIYFYLAAFQFLTGFIILAANSLSYKNTLPEILIYWALILLYFIVVVSIDINKTLMLLIIPMLIAMYHCYMTFKLKKL